MQDAVQEVRKGNECGIILNGFDEFQVGDIIQCFEKVLLSPRPFCSSSSPNPYLHRDKCEEAPSSLFPNLPSQPPPSPHSPNRLARHQPHQQHLLVTPPRDSNLQDRHPARRNRTIRKPTVTDSVVKEFGYSHDLSLPFCNKLSQPNKIESGKHHPQIH